jgi:hypothetical protein
MWPPAVLVVLLAGLAAACAGGEDGVEPVAARSCGALLYEGEGEPDVIVVADNPRRGGFGRRDQRGRPTSSSATTRARSSKARRRAAPFVALAAKLSPALVLYAHQHRPHVSAAGQPALVGLGSFRDGRASAVVLDSAETGRLVRALCLGQAAARPEAVGPAH